MIFKGLGVLGGQRRPSPTAVTVQSQLLSFGFFHGEGDAPSMTPTMPWWGTSPKRSLPGSFWSSLGWLWPPSLPPWAFPSGPRWPPFLCSSSPESTGDPQGFGQSLLGVTRLSAEDGQILWKMIVHVFTSLKICPHSALIPGEATPTQRLRGLCGHRSSPGRAGPHLSNL